MSVAVGYVPFVGVMGSLSALARLPKCATVWVPCTTLVVHHETARSPGQRPITGLTSDHIYGLFQEATTHLSQGREKGDILLFRTPSFAGCYIRTVEAVVLQIGV